MCVTGNTNAIPWTQLSPFRFRQSRADSLVYTRRDTLPGFLDSSAHTGFQLDITDSTHFFTDYRDTRLTCEENGWNTVRTRVVHRSTSIVSYRRAGTSELDCTKESLFSERRRWKLVRIAAAAAWSWRCARTTIVNTNQLISDVFSMNQKQNNIIIPINYRRNYFSLIFEFYYTSNKNNS